MYTSQGIAKDLYRSSQQEIYSEILKVTFWKLRVAHHCDFGRFPISMMYQKYRQILIRNIKKQGTILAKKI